ncbi:hypothetical protein ACUHMQ_09550 [Chitinimonas sp. PSY-7]|uniref:hypothetical protein n=1 Tax=Chitinimonas sp. PSY-7 TaxID=3459088 RepID=UPI0040402FBB
MKCTSRKYIISGAVAAVLLAGCSTLHTTILPRENGVYQITATASTPREATDGAIEKATKTCESQGKRLVVLNNEDQSKPELERNAKSVANKVLTATGYKMFFSFDTDSDGKMSMLFKCE